MLGNVMVSQIDEVPFVNSTKTFAEHFSVKSTGIIEEEVSPATQSDWYGPAYPIFFGTFRLIFGNSEKSFIYTNMLILAAIIFLISRFPIDPKNTKWLMVVTLLNPALFNYSFFFMPVVLDLFFSVVLLLMLANINKRYLTEDIKLRGFIYLLMVLLFSLFKQNFIFFSFGLLVYSKNLKWFSTWLFTIILTFAALLAYNKFFLAPAYAVILKDASNSLAALNIKEFISLVYQNFIKNIAIIFKADVFPAFMLPYYMVLLFPFVFFFVWISQRNRLVSAILIILFLSLSCYLFLYTTDATYFVRLTVPLGFTICFCILYFEEKTNTVLKYSILGLLMLFLTLTVLKVVRFQDMKKECYNSVMRFSAPFQSITSEVDKDKMNTIMIDPLFYETYGFKEFLMALPYTAGSQIIRYTVNYRQKDKFALLGRIKVDYLLTPTPVSLPNTSLVNQNNYYCLYKFTY